MLLHYVVQRCLVVLLRSSWKELAGAANVPPAAASGTTNVLQPQFDTACATRRVSLISRRSCTMQCFLLTIVPIESETQKSFRQEVACYLLRQCIRFEKLDPFIFTCHYLRVTQFIDFGLRALGRMRL